MTKKNEQNSTHPGAGSISMTSTSATTVTNTATTSGIVIVQQQPISEQQQHFLLPAVNNAGPMIITTPLAVPSMMTQQLPTTNVQQSQQMITAAMSSSPVTLVAPPPTGATNSTVVNKTTKSPGQDRLVCSLCNKVYRSSAGLRYHKRKRHRDEGMLKPTQLHRVRCLENGCVFQMLAISDLRNHLANHHMKPEYKTTEEKKFNSFTEFTEWKSTFEQSSGSKYVKNCGSKGKSENQTTEYYYCNRTGPYKQTRQGWRRNSKALDSLRCGIHCTSSMKVDISRNDQISVQYYPAHYGHTAEPPLQAPPSSAANGTSALSTVNGESIEHASVQQQTIPSIQTVVHAAVQQQTQTTTDHCVRLQHQHHAQTSSIIINIAPIFLLLALFRSLLFFLGFFVSDKMTKKGSSAASSPSAALENAPGSGRFICSMCAKVYRSGAGLRYHKRKRHRGMVEPTALHRVKCQEPGCTYQMLAISDLRNHLANHHQKPEYKCTEEKKFNSVADFTDWKSSFETRTGSKYVKNCGAKGKSDNQTTEYYYCNRTGPYKTVGQGLRRSKAQGSLRCGIHCTSSMKVEIQNDEQITVQYYPAHYGHSHLPATDEPHLSENSLTIGGMNGNSSSSAMNNSYHQHQPQQQQHDNGHAMSNQYPSHNGDCSSSSSPGSASTSPSGGSNSNSNHPATSSMGASIDRSSMSMANVPSKNNMTISNHHHHHHQQQQQQHQQQQHQQHHSLQNQMSHCIIISPSFMVEENASSHSNHHAAPVLVVQQQQQQQAINHALPPSSSSTATIIAATTNLAVKKEKCVSDIMREAFQLLSYWPLDHHHGLVTAENEQPMPHSHLNMDEHLMF